MRPSPLLLTQTRQQAAIVNCDERLLIVEANAGAAKTTTLAMRIERALATGIAPAEILALAYTDAGREALLKTVLSVGVHPTVARQVSILTVDEFAAIRLRALQGDSSKPPKRETSRPRTPERVKPYVLEAIRQARSAGGRYSEEFNISGDGELAVEGLLRAFRQIKGAMLMESVSEEFVLTPASASEVIGWDYTALMVLSAYEALRAGDVWVDGDIPVFRYLDDATYDLAVMLGSIYAPFDDASHPLSLGLSLIVVDEMHDMNRAMFTILRGLLDRNPDASFVGVGDIDQVIHSEAAADSYFMRQGFDMEAGKATRLSLGASYRFGSALANLLSMHASKQYLARQDRDTKVELAVLDSPRDLRLFISQALTERHGLQPRSPHGELAVLLRHPSRCVELENELLDGGIEYVTYGFESYLRRPEVLFVRAVLCCALRMIDSVESKEVRRQMIYSLLLFSGVSKRSSMEGVRDEVVAQEWDAVAKLTVGNEFIDEKGLDGLLERLPQQARNCILEAMGIARGDQVGDVAKVVTALDVGWFASRVLVLSADVNAAQESVQGLVAAAKDFDSISSLLRGMSQRELSLEQMRRKRTGIRLSTIEAAKGLEFDHVIMPDVNAGEFDGGHADDQNLFYVGASRAKHLLTFTHRPGRPSSYLHGVD